MLGPGSLGVFARDPDTGALTQLDGTAGCFSEDGADGCTTVPALRLVRRLAVSPDGRNLYAVGQRVAVFARDPGTGALMPLPGEAGCIEGLALQQTAGCATARGLGSFEDVAVSADGRNVYISDRGFGAVAVFARDASTGALSQLPQAQGCVVEMPGNPSAPGCAFGRGLGTGTSSHPNAVTVGPEGRSVYTASPIFGDPGDRSAVGLFVRDPATGALTQRGGAAACMSHREFGERGCAAARAIGAPSEVTVSPNGRSLYVSSTALIGPGPDQGGEIAVFARDPATGAAKQLPGRAACLRLRAVEPGCASATLADVSALAITRDGASAYVADGLEAGKLGVLARSTATGRLAQLPGQAGCLTRSGSGGRCQPIRGMYSPTDVTTSPDARNVYASTRNGGVIVLARRR